MSLTNKITTVILEMLNETGQTELQRNELAQEFGCAPSQINYVISSRFTPEHGYLVESRRGGGGYIRIKRVDYEKTTILMHVINTVGIYLDERTCYLHLNNLLHQGFLTQKEVDLIFAATSNQVYQDLTREDRDRVRSAVFKRMLVSTI